MKKLVPVVQSHGKHLTNAIDQRIGTNESAIIEGTYLLRKATMAMYSRRMLQWCPYLLERLSTSSVSLL